MQLNHLRVWNNPDPKDVPNILVDSFHGAYPAGSLGNAHGQFIASATLHGLVHFEPWCVILDFRGLEYSWGNTLLSVFQQIAQYMSPDPGEPVFPFIVVTSDKCRDAFLSLVTPTGSNAPDWHFDNFDEALENAVERANRWIDAKVNNAMHAMPDLRVNLKRTITDSGSVIADVIRLNYGRY